MTVSYDKLRELAAAADGVTPSQLWGECEQSVADARLIALCDPATISELVREVLAAREKLQPLCRACGFAPCRSVYDVECDVPKPAKAEPVATLTPDYAALIEQLRDWPDMCEQYSHRAAAAIESLQSFRAETERQYQAKVAEIGVLLDRAETAEARVTELERTVAAHEQTIIDYVARLAHA